MSTTFKQYLIEGLSTKEIYDVVEEIVTNCKPYLNEIKDPHNYMLYRGVSQLVSPTGDIHNTHRDRIPSDTSSSFHKALDEWFVNKFNIRFRSHYSMFCTPNMHQAASYGNVCVIYPIGKINYIWAPKMRDLFAYIAHKERINNISQNTTPEEAYKHINKWFNEDNVEYYFNTQLTSNANNEVMIHVPSYYVIPLQTQQTIEYGLAKRMK
jgi:hypothetical protein